MTAALRDEIPANVTRIGPNEEIEIHAWPDCLGLDRPVEALAPWVYDEPALLELEKEAIFRRSWQMACHVSDIPAPGDFQVFDLLDDSVIVLRGRDGEPRAFMNACRHRAARLLDGKGRCGPRLQCPYHGWTYDLEGRLKSLPLADSFPDIDRTCHGLTPVPFEIFHGFVFIRIKGDGLSVADEWGTIGDDLAAYGAAELEPLHDPLVEIWDCNWKLAVDNYQDVYHVPMGHPGLYRLLGLGLRMDLERSGVSRGIQNLTEKPSARWSERLYLDLVRNEGKRLPDPISHQWRNYTMLPNLGIDAFPEMISTFQLIPLAIEKTLVRMAVYGHPDATRSEKARCYLIDRISRNVGEEDRDFCRRVQRGLKTSEYRPGPLSQLEVCTAQFHEYLRERMTVVRAPRRPAPEVLREASRTAATER